MGTPYCSPSPFLAAIFMLWLVVIIEKLIHTTYTVTPDGKFVLSFGLFSRSKEILMKATQETLPWNR